MPYKDPEKQREAIKKASQRFRDKKRSEGDEEYLAKEKARKAEWYAQNKEKKAEAQRRYRARKKEEES